jgi:acyl-CoA reductase-like NAD-dependent aldehyde dehydrogenase
MTSVIESNRPATGWDSTNEFTRVSGTFFGRSGYASAGDGPGTDVVNPANDRVIGRIVEPSASIIDEVVGHANEAQRDWYALSALERAETLHHVAARLRDLRPQIAELLTLETGKAFKESYDELTWTTTAIDYYAEVGRHSVGSLIGNTVPGQMHYVIKEPMGTVVSILPANYPILLFMWSAAAALAAGNAVVVKPSEYASLTTLSYMRVFDGLVPSGLVQCVTGGADAAKQLVAHPQTHMVSFTGSVSTGRAVARACADTFKPFLIEASGSDAFIVMPSAPLDIAARAATFAAFLNNGQVCTSAEKILVHEDIYDEFVAKVVEHTAALRIGHGLDDVDLGPLENRRELERIEGLLNRTIAEGANVRLGGKRLVLEGELSRGFFFEPTIIENVTPDMEIYGTEVFGPVAPIYKVSSFDEAIEIANGSPFGLGATLYSKDSEEIDRATREIVTGMVWINAPLLDNDAGPFGGRKLSGIGRQLGSDGLDTFRHPKLVLVDPKAASQDFWWFPYASDESYSSAGEH